MDEVHTTSKPKLFVLGNSNVGKTLLVQALKGHGVSSSANSYGSKFKSQPTEGIVVEEFSLSDPEKSFQEPIIFRVWDFSGQELYLTTHQYFLLSDSIYLLVWNANVDDFSRIDYWLDLIRASTKNSTILLIGTHWDERDESTFSDFWNQISLNYKDQFVIGVDSKNGTGIKELKSFLYNLSKPKVTSISNEILLVLEIIHEIRKKTPKNQVIDIRDLKDKVKSSYAEYPDRIFAQSLSNLHDNGEILHFVHHKQLSKYVILDPQWLADIFSHTLKESRFYVKNGILEKRTLDQIWKHYSRTYRQNVSYLLYQFEIIHPYRVDDVSEGFRLDHTLLFLPIVSSAKGVEEEGEEEEEEEIEGDTPTKNEGQLLIACLLPEKKPDFSLLWPPKTTHHQLIREWKLAFIPSGLMSIIIVRILQQETLYGLQKWRDGVLLKYHSEIRKKVDRAQRLALVELDVSFRVLRLSVRDQFSSPITFFRHLLEIITNVLEGWFQVTVEEEFIPCSQCRMRGEDSGHRFTIDECDSSAALGEMYLFCPSCESLQRLDYLAPDVTLLDLISIPEQSPPSSCRSSLSASPIPSPRRRTSNSSFSSTSSISVNSSISSSGNRGTRAIKSSELEYIQKLGAGAYGTVWLGKYKGREVAIKQRKYSTELKPLQQSLLSIVGGIGGGDQHSLATLYREFRREVWILSSLLHDNIVRVIGYCTPTDEDPSSSSSSSTIPPSPLSNSSSSSSSSSNSSLSSNQGPKFINFLIVMEFVEGGTLYDFLTDPLKIRSYCDKLLTITDRIVINGSGQSEGEMEKIKSSKDQESITQKQAQSQLHQIESMFLEIETSLPKPNPTLTQDSSLSLSDNEQYSSTSSLLSSSSQLTVPSQIRRLASTNFFKLLIKEISTNIYDQTVCVDKVRQLVQELMSFIQLTPSDISSKLRDILTEVEKLKSILKTLHLSSDVRKLLKLTSRLELRSRRSSCRSKGRSRSRSGSSGTMGKSDSLDHSVILQKQNLPQITLTGSPPTIQENEAILENEKKRREINVGRGKEGQIRGGEGEEEKEEEEEEEEEEDKRQKELQNGIEEFIKNIWNHIREKNKQSFQQMRASYDTLETIYHLFRPPLSWPLRLRLALDIAEGMAFLHNTYPPVLHRDLKTPNILLTRVYPRSEHSCIQEPLAKVSDFGLSTLNCISTLRADEHIQNINPLWLAPEVLSGSEYSEKADVYALGIILWELYVREQPFLEYKSKNGAFEQEQLKRKITEGLRPRLPQLDPNVYDPKQLHSRYRNLITSCWQSDPQSRPTFPEVVLQLQLQMLDSLEEEANPSHEKFIKSHKKRLEPHPNDGRKKTMRTKLFRSTTFIHPSDSHHRPENYVYRLCEPIQVKHISIPLSSSVACPNTHILFVGTSTGSICLMSSQSGKIENEFPKSHETMINSMLYFPDSCLLWTSGMDGNVKVWKYISNISPSHKEKRGPILIKGQRKWKSRWMVLKNSTLKIYSSSDEKLIRSMIDLTEPLVEINREYNPLTFSIRYGSSQSDDEEEYPNINSLETSSEGDESSTKSQFSSETFKVSSLIELEEWMTTLRNEIESTRPIILVKSMTVSVTSKSYPLVSVDKSVWNFSEGGMITIWQSDTQSKRTLFVTESITPTNSNSLIGDPDSQITTKQKKTKEAAIPPEWNTFKGSNKTRSQTRPSLTPPEPQPQKRVPRPYATVMAKTSRTQNSKPDISSFFHALPLGNSNPQPDRSSIDNEKDIPLPSNSSKTSKAFGRMSKEVDEEKTKRSIFSKWRSHNSPLSSSGGSGIQSNSGSGSGGSGSGSGSTGNLLASLKEPLVISSPHPLISSAGSPNAIVNPRSGGGGSGPLVGSMKTVSISAPNSGETSPTVSSPPLSPTHDKEKHQKTEKYELNQDNEKYTLPNLVHVNDNVILYSKSSIYQFNSKTLIQEKDLNVEHLILSLVIVLPYESDSQIWILHDNKTIRILKLADLSAVTIINLKRQPKLIFSLTSEVWVVYSNKEVEIFSSQTHTKVEEFKTLHSVSKFISVTSHQSLFSCSLDENSLCFYRLTPFPHCVLPTEEIRKEKTPIHPRLTPPSIH